MADDDDELEIKDVSEMPADEMVHFKQLLRTGKVQFAPEALASLEKIGLTTDDAIAMMIKALKAEQ